MSRVKVTLELQSEERFALLALADHWERSNEPPIYRQAARALRVALEDLKSSKPSPKPKTRAPARGTKAPDDRSARAKLIRAVLEVRPDAALHVLVSIAAVRQRLGWPKHLFDATVFALAREGAVTLHEHDHPWGLSPEERAELVADEAGRHYIGLVLEVDAESHARAAAPARAVRASAEAPDAVFLADVERAARASSDGWFDAERVFIGRVWRRLRQAPEYRALGLDAFKARLLRLNGRGVTLGRAELPSVMNPADLAESEVFQRSQWGPEETRFVFLKYR